MRSTKTIFGVILGLFFVLGTAVQTPGQSKKDTPLNVMSYNIRLNTSGDGVNAWPNRKERVAGLVRFHKADLFGVQEALPEQMKDLTARFPDFDYVGVGRDDGISAGEHMAIFYRKSRFEKQRDGHFWLSPTPEKPGLGWDAACNRTCTWIKLKDKITRKSFYMFNTHLDHRGKTARQEGVQLILKRMPEINKEQLPLILTGDFNQTRPSPVIDAVLRVLSDAKDKSITPPYGPDSTSGGFEVRKGGNTIDFIFVNDRVRVLRHGVLSDSFNLYYPSDHLPVLAEVQIQ
ncbi:MAG TPA: endonuclease/exonuclease/phosphatase family protein [Candidatus Paceibacterota bacterium]|nr:endonuclease/exonuclease/phosphatase family protein [Verrucomicrobiota bacterium]HRY49410.1 endonuclease/exonuclease/phosphatase family protein [Candidatus Paceibacterota bacterium]